MGPVVRARVDASPLRAPHPTREQGARRGEMVTCPPGRVRPVAGAGTGQDSAGQVTSFVAPQVAQISVGGGAGSARRGRTSQSLAPHPAAPHCTRNSRRASLPRTSTRAGTDSGCSRIPPPFGKVTPDR